MPIPQRIQPIFYLVLASFKRSLGESLYLALEQKVYYENESLTDYERNPTVENEAKLVIDFMRFVFTKGFAMSEMGVDFSYFQSEAMNIIAKTSDLNLVLAFYKFETQVAARGRVNDGLITKYACQQVFDIEARQQIPSQCKAFLPKIEDGCKSAFIIDLLGWYGFMGAEQMSATEVVEWIKLLPTNLQKNAAWSVLCDSSVKTAELDALVVELQKQGFVFAADEQMKGCSTDDYQYSTNYAVCSSIMRQNPSQEFALAWIKALRAHELDPIYYPNCNGLAMLVVQTIGVDEAEIGLCQEILEHLSSYFYTSHTVEEFNKRLDTIFEMAQKIRHAEQPNLKLAISAFEFIATTATADVHKSAYKELGDIFWNGESDVAADPLRAAKHYHDAGLRYSPCLLLSGAARSAGMQVKSTAISAVQKVYAQVEERLPEIVRRRLIA